MGLHPKDAIGWYEIEARDPVLDAMRIVITHALRDDEPSGPDEAEA